MLALVFSLCWCWFCLLLCLRCCLLMACVSFAGLQLCWIFLLVGCHGVGSPCVGLSLCCLFCCWGVVVLASMSALVGFMVFVLAVIVLVSAVLFVGHGFVVLSSLVGFISVGFPLLAAMVLALLVLAVTVLFVIVLGVVVLALGFASVYPLCWQLWCRLWCWLWCVLCVGVGSVCFCVCCVVGL